MSAQATKKTPKKQQQKNKKKTNYFSAVAWYKPPATLRIPSKKTLLRFLSAQKTLFPLLLHERATTVNLYISDYTFYIYCILY